jgi:hypothetical protein
VAKESAIVKESQFHRVCSSGLLLAAAIVWFAPLSSRGAEDNVEAVGEHVAAGEFAPALAMARNVADPELRDRLLGEISVAQAAVGAERASMTTLLDVSNDLTRHSLARAMRERPLGGGGGAAMADFDTLMDLITSTIAPDSWDDVGGAGAIEPFPTGVYVDASGMMKRLAPSSLPELLMRARDSALADTGNRDPRRTSTWRKVSLVRLERQLQLLHAFGRSPGEALRMLAGLYRIEYLVVYPELEDIVIIGPAGDWHADPEGRVINVETGTPVIQLDDLVTVLRSVYIQGGRFGCAIKPRQENLAAAKAFLESWSGKAVPVGQSEPWVADLRRTLGRQDIEVWGMDAGTHAARILIEADHHMKLIGMGLEEGTLGVTSYLDAVKQAGDRDLAMTVLRWWFVPDYDAVRTNADRNAFRWEGAGARVLSENEMLTARGERIHTGTSDALNTQFAHSFTRHFDALAAKYPVYAELRNVFDLALLGAILRGEDVPAQVNWHMTHILDPAACVVATSPAPREVESVVNAVHVNRRRFVAGVSGGVAVDTTQLLSSESVQVGGDQAAEAARTSAQPDPTRLPRDIWWWD